MRTIIGICREISKIILFTLIWGFPFYMARVLESNYFLWFFILSFFVNIGMFEHYESLEKLDKADVIKSDTKEEE